MPRPKSRTTTTIRVPTEYKDLLLDFVRQLDRLKGGGDQFAAPPKVCLDWAAYWQEQMKL